MRTALYAVAAVLGAGLALVGSEPVWLLAIAALIAFPLAAGAALRKRRGRDGASLGPLLATALAGGLLTALALRLAIGAPDWLNAGAADCGGASESTQDSVLAAATVLFLAAAAAMAFNLVAVLLRSGPDEEGRPLTLSLYPAAVAMSGLALVGASFATSCP